MKTLELFSGTGSFSKVARKKGYSTLTIDNDPRHKPDILTDILKWQPPNHLIGVDILWASPPCQTFSIASVSHHWRNGRPTNARSRNGVALLRKTLNIIADLRPVRWYIENPRGMMRKIFDREAKKLHLNYIRHTVTYCQYGLRIMKPTDIWTNDLDWTPRPMCSPGDPCHERSPRGSKKGVQGIQNKAWEKARGSSAIRRAIIPAGLIQELI